MRTVIFVDTGIMVIGFPLFGPAVPSRTTIFAVPGRIRIGGSRLAGRFGSIACSPFIRRLFREAGSSFFLIFNLPEQVTDMPPFLVKVNTYTIAVV